MSDRLNQQNSPALPQFQICLVSCRLFAVRARAPSSVVLLAEPYTTFVSMVQLSVNVCFVCG